MDTIAFGGGVRKVCWLAGYDPPPKSCTSTSGDVMKSTQSRRNCRLLKITARGAQATERSRIVKADQSLRGVPGDEEVNWGDPSLSTRAVREYLEALEEEAWLKHCPSAYR